MSDPCVIVSHIAATVSCAQELSFRTMHSPDVSVLFGGLSPSVGHGVCVVKIFPSDWRYQAHLYRGLLSVQVRTRVHPSSQCELLAFHALANQSTEFLWKQVLRRPRSRAGVTKQCAPCRWWCRDRIVHIHVKLAITKICWKFSAFPGSSLCRPCLFALLFFVTMHQHAQVAKTEIRFEKNHTCWYYRSAGKN